MTKNLPNLPFINSNYKTKSDNIYLTIFISIDVARISLAEIPFNI
jgi:hypothetical protein